MFEIRMPRVNTNDETGVLDRWLVEDGAEVTTETVVAVIETSKASYDLTSDFEGLLHRLAEEGEEYPVGKPIAYVFADEDERRSFLDEARTSAAGASSQPADASAVAGLVITRDARKLIDERGITDAQIAALGKKVVKSSDLEALLCDTASEETVQPSELVELSRRQRAIAETVSRSHASIPRAFTAVKLPCDDVLAGLAEIAESEDVQVGLPELLVRTLGTLREEFPFFYGEVLPSHQFRPAPTTDVGITLDVGQGLFIPVVRSPATKSLAEIADVLMELRIKALRNNFRQEELTGGALTLSLNNDDDVLVAEPLILPGQSCMVSLGGVHSELVLTGDGQVAERKVAYLGLSYDHRVINGSDGISFLNALKKGMDRSARREQHGEG